MEQSRLHLVPKAPRLVALDLLRGLTIGFMILVNDNGDGNGAYWALKHAAWNGFTPTDLVFPTFLFLVGISTVLSTAKRLARGESKLTLFTHTLRRAVVLYLLGLLVNSFPHFALSTMRFYGVLPRIALCYLVIASLYLVSRGWRDKLVLALAALLGYWMLMRLVPVPGYGVPTHQIPLLDRDANLAAWLDRAIFAAPHLYERTRDPEGLLSTLPAVATALFGMLTGQWLQSARSAAQKLKGIALAGLLSLALGAAWNPWFPINKKLWTSSYVFFAAGWSLLLLALWMWVEQRYEQHQEQASERRVSPPWWHTVLLVFGTNAIAAYVLSELLASAIGSIHLASGHNVQQAAYLAIHAVIGNVPLASLVYSLLYVAVCWVPVWMLYRSRIFLKI
ncbi:MAG: DUF1624 domain-containing protein [Acidobacteriota bacterium]|nr:DUF1624 domain-containing protein [Acidobacteriota bacterium]